MAIKVSCKCGKKISAKDQLAGRQVKCPACKKPLRIPKPEAEEESYGDNEQPVQSRRTANPTGPGRSKSPMSGHKPSSSKPKSNLLLGLSVGGGTLLVVVLAWMLWPSEPNGDVANNLTNAEGETTDAVSVTDDNPNSGSVSNGHSADASRNVVARNPASDDLASLQGVWG